MASLKHLFRHSFSDFGIINVISMRDMGSRLDNNFYTMKITHFCPDGELLFQS